MISQQLGTASGHGLVWPVVAEIDKPHPLVHGLEVRLRARVLVPPPGGGSLRGRGCRGSCCFPCSGSGIDVTLGGEHCEEGGLGLGVVLVLAKEAEGGLGAGAGRGFRRRGGERGCALVGVGGEGGRGGRRKRRGGIEGGSMEEE